MYRKDKPMTMLRKLRLNAGLSQKEAAILIGCSPTCLSDWESGRYRPRISRLHKVADLYHVSTMDILDALDNPYMMRRDKDGNGYRQAGR